MTRRMTWPSSMGFPMGFRVHGSDEGYDEGYFKGCWQLLMFVVLSISLLSPAGYSLPPESRLETETIDWCAQ